ncbi:hypothetical protein HNR75_001155 [Tolumonas osonensis]|uniref:Uncharacterized protein n=1 Tax=Tolumonas osonensis TaxID=675874 RepID=A0A841GP69_9GAMM|nr:hypothetical protein [Tolumonas osonensis]
MSFQIKVSYSQGNGLPKESLIASVFIISSANGIPFNSVVNESIH